MRGRQRAQIPDGDGRFGCILVLDVEDAERRRVEAEARAFARRQPDPPRREHAQEVSMRDERDEPAQPVQRRDQRVGARADLLRRLAAGAAVAEEVPAGAPRLDFGERQALVLAAVPVTQVQVEPRRAAEAGEDARFLGAPERARQDVRKPRRLQPLAEDAGLALPARGERQIGPPGVAMVARPLRFTVADDIDGDARLLSWQRPA